MNPTHISPEEAERYHGYSKPFDYKRKSNPSSFPQAKLFLFDKPRQAYFCLTLKLNHLILHSFSEIL